MQKRYKYIGSHIKHSYVRCLSILIILAYVGSVIITCLSEWEHDHKHVTPVVQLAARTSTEILPLPVPKPENYATPRELTYIYNVPPKSGRSINANADNTVSFLIFFLTFISLGYFLFIPVGDRTHLKRSRPRTHLLIQRFLN